MSVDKSMFIGGVTSKYPEELLEGRITVEGNVIACLAKDILLLDENKFKTEQWITKDGRFYFELLKHLRSCGINTVDEISILSNCSEKIVDAFNNKGVWARISIIAAGPIFNFILAFILSLIVVGYSGWDFASLKVMENMPAAEAGLKDGDIVFGMIFAQGTSGDKDSDFSAA